MQKQYGAETARALTQRPFLACGSWTRRPSAQQGLHAAPHRLLLATIEVTEESQLPGASRVDADQALERLSDLGLLEVVKQSGDGSGETLIRLHRLVLAFTRIVSEDTQAQAMVERAVVTEATRLSDARLPAPILAFQAHLRAVTEAARPRQDSQLASLCALLGWHLTLLSAYSEARRYLQESIAIRTATRGADHPETAGSLNMLGLLHQWEGDLAAAQPCFEQALAIWEHTLDPHHHYIAVALDNLGLVLTERGAYDKAQRLLTRALSLCLHTLGPEHPTTLRTRTNLGRLLTLRGAYGEARRELEQALAVRTRTLPAPHPSLAQTLTNLGELERTQGAYPAAWRYHQQALSMRQALHGERHSAVAESLAYLGAVLHAQGKLAEARKHLERALAIDEALLGSQHLETAQILDGLGQVYLAAGE